MSINISLQYCCCWSTIYNYNIQKLSLRLKLGGLPYNITYSTNTKLSIFASESTSSQITITNTKIIIFSTHHAFLWKYSLVVLRTKCVLLGAEFFLHKSDKNKITDLSINPSSRIIQVKWYKELGVWTNLCVVLIYALEAVEPSRNPFLNLRGSCFL
jgi:hypothetical protein